MRNVFLLIGALLIFSCSGENIEEQEIEFNPAPSINITDNKSIKVRLSSCVSNKTNSDKKTILKSSITNGEVKLLLGSSLSCDFKQGAFIKELLNTPDTLKFEMYQKGSRLSNECKCYFYYEITLSNKSKLPKFIYMGKEVYSYNLQEILTSRELEVIEESLKN